MKPAIVVFDEAPHFLDHLAPLAIWLDMPLLIPSFKDYSLVKEYYPEADCHFIDFKELVLTELLKTYDLLLYSTASRKAFEKEVGTAIKTVFVPHGNSDKDVRKEIQEEEMAFIYGQRMHDFLRPKNYITVGNYRKEYFAHKKYPSPLQFARKQKTILYAPTLESFHPEILDVPDHLNLVIKPHPFFARERSGFLATIPLKDNIQVLEEYPLVYPLLKEVDIYVGDISSLGYDFLACDKPLFFIGKEPLYSHCFGHRISKDIYKEIEKNSDSYQKARQEAYAYTFAPVPSKKSVYESLKKYYEA